MTEPWIEELLHADANVKMTEKQVRIVKAAIEVFAQKGFAASSTSEIAQRAGVAEGTIFRHYKTKKDLLLSIVAPSIVKLMAPFVLREFKDVLDTEYESYDQFLRVFIENRIDFLQHNMSLVRIVLQELPFHPDLQAQLQEIIVSQVKERVEKIIRRFQAEGKLVELPTGTVIRLTASVIIGYVLARSLFIEKEQSEWNDEQEREATISFLMKALTP
ncbi:TetR/AcrR family transcriptional regulator [Paenibacillus thiaminolyticus]|uniref:TetR/AcrR family transcriptional regulator n=1 Tax=Paenibacillus thiaminolyticus TaxID=49283 RepID=A0AAP9J3R9_PANTH|nr:TetR/AcrR family transcriptional regulator [Paenibacillus thiaminolyticus]MCY9535030.1 TetR/AcrR family transcriptional regulator [Paenibacillus thiaminolyticus]MCY9605041.1 TetR/AcrR family transcriptional regulator [Paenibacillus thiaminolyticus]MCY9610392.1 TetR/AcrR family transcriptional regulator [Paenibacillus thiaminolyticus]MCY9616841.1 TetR/AcrR family transcriptional regulator [Paenibacillus thiaminolyticus]MCY9622468.1 TetR/AcrR family transcriptional regulator [Paenibacillus th